MGNLDLWDNVRRVPQEHLKPFTRGGGFSGTAIKPMWAIKAMTERFGPCGEGWGIEQPEFTIQNSGDEILVFCTVGVWHLIDGKQSALVWGVGGDKVLAQFKSGPKPDDEAFKKAFTDAIGNALKFLGVGADIHMGLWDGNKYADEPKDRETKTKAQSRESYSSMIVEMKKSVNLEMLKDWVKRNREDVEALPPDWFKESEASYADLRDSLEAKAA